MPTDIRKVLPIIPISVLRPKKFTKQFRKKIADDSQCNIAQRHADDESKSAFYTIINALFKNRKNNRAYSNA